MLTTDQTKRAEHSRHRRLEGVTHTAPIAAFRYAVDGPQLDSRCARLGEDTDAVLAELGYGPEQLQHLRGSGVI